jgi:hypothetical protein
MKISSSDYKKFFLNKNIVDCVVRDRNIFYFLTREDYKKWSRKKLDLEVSPPPDEEDIQKHVVPWMRSKEPSQQWTAGNLDGFNTLLAGVSIKPKPQFVGVDSYGHVYATGSKENGIEDDIQSFSSGGPKRGGVRKLKNINGWLYFCGGNNSLGKRVEKGKWQSFSQFIPNPDRKDNLSNTFEDLDGYSEQDIYCVGDGGQVYHFDGMKWDLTLIPTNIDFETVCCAGDGFVYISGEKGTTFKGRGSRWELIHKGNSTLPFRDMVWYEDRVWCTSDHGVWTIKDDKITTAEIPDGMSAYAGNLSTADGVLLLAGYGGAAFLENGQWTKVFSVAEMSKLISAEKK